MSNPASAAFRAAQPFAQAFAQPFVQHQRHKLRALLGSLLLSVLLCPPELAQAQGDSLPNLIFDPVLLDVVTADTADPAAPYTVQELTALPQGKATDLQAWLDANRTTATTTVDDVASNIAAYEQSIQDVEVSGGAFDPRLEQDLLSLASQLQQAGDFARAQEVLDRALHINRVNKGLFSQGQIPIIERTIENYLARGDLVAADEQQQYLLYVQRKNFGDNSVDLLPALTHYAEWNLFAFRARVVPAAPPTGSEAEGNTLDSPPDEDEGSMLNFRTNRLINAHNVYQSIINIVTSNFGAADSRLLNYERQLALTNYFFITTFGLNMENTPSVTQPFNTYLPFETEASRPPLGFRQGRDALERRISYLANAPGVAPAEKARAKLDLGDWLLMFSKRMTSLEVYQQAWQEMAATGASREELDAIFNPAFPQEIPSFLAPPFTRVSLDIPADLALEYKGYIDVEFELSRFGVPSSASALGRSSTASPALETRLLRNLRRSQFRPRIVGGNVRDDETVRARYYFTY